MAKIEWPSWVKMNINVLKCYKDILPTFEVYRWESIQAAAFSIFTDDYIDDYQLIIAAEKGREDIVRFLVSRGANIHVNSNGPLCAAATYGHESIVKYLVSIGGGGYPYQ